ncbi:MULTISPECIES: DUF1778 domain-containing protein [Burkholderia cepacia complex]|uniref:CopG-like ribbon-helix-helix domain-containing protein n=1 Tax=Burkholderia vietnamiensis TaxID=60552 RepID=A0ABS1B2I2_BURVI|nr:MULTISPECIES: hypothetical protein [Burkholderia cepacia complex]KWH56865.1 hypothetical protein WM00_12540 [Burkholderia cepacia]MBJ9690584.1 hypothetical protein [Burkholderia vietnamiensis]OUE48169.1 hypothetical protein BZY94_02465 [Burkholderia territorii]OXI19434.1 hypothetical protein CFB35_17660 [Burkholderia sp. AU16482]
MPAGKTETINVRVRPDLKRLLQEAAEYENRSQTNLLETLILDHCRKLGLVVPPRVTRIESEG